MSENTITKVQDTSIPYEVVERPDSEFIGIEIPGKMAIMVLGRDWNKIKDTVDEIFDRRKSS